MPRQQRRHKVFVSYHHENDQEYKDRLVEEMSASIVNRSVEDGDVDASLTTGAIWEKIRNDYIADASVLLVLIGRDTWSRKFVDWEIGSALNKSKNNSRCGVLGVILPDHPDYGNNHLNPNLLPKRLVANTRGPNPYVRLYDWPTGGSLSAVRDWVDTAFLRRNGPRPHNYSRRFKKNRATSTRDTGGMTLREDLLLAGALIVGAWALDRFLRKSMRAEIGAPTHSPNRLRYVPPNPRHGLQSWIQGHGPI